MIAPANPSSADFFEDVWGVATDPLKLGKASTELSDSVERTMIQLRSLEGVANSHATERLEQIRSIVKDAIDGSYDEVQKSIKSMRELDKQVNKDAMNLVYNVKCASDITFMDTAQKSFAGLI